MKILHYSLGFPPFRTGGMTKYCMDLIEAQGKEGDSVSLLYPGKYSWINPNVHIKKGALYRISDEIVCQGYELINPMPVPLVDGISDTTHFMCEKKDKRIEEFFWKNKFDILHIHTLMGLPQELVKVVKKNNIKVVFSTHDYFGLCPKTSFVYGKEVCPHMDNCSLCEKCNKNALTINKIKFLQSNFYKVIKQTSIVKKLRRKHIKDINSTYQNFEKDDFGEDKTTSDKYVLLRKYYTDILSAVDAIHYNSTNTKRIYNQFVKGAQEFVITITNKEIEEHREKKKVPSQDIRIGYLGPQSVRKGFYVLLSCMDCLYEKYKNIKLVVYNGYCQREYIESNLPYTYDKLGNVMESLDFLIVPSVCYETFGFTVIEALSYGVPVIVSGSVGARDVIEEGKNGYVFETEDELYRIIENIINEPSILQKMNEYIFKSGKIKNIATHEREIKELYKRII